MVGHARAWVAGFSGPVDASFGSGENRSRRIVQPGLRNRIKPDCIVVKQSLPVIARKGRCDRIKAPVYFVEPRAQAVDRKIAAEHAAFDAKEIDDGHHDVTIPVRRPGQAGRADAGDLDGDVGEPRDARHRRAPGRKPRFAAIRRQTRMIDDDLCVGKVAGKIGRLIKMPPRRLQIESQSMLAEFRKTIPRQNYIFRKIAK
jgi:hypothetical protein